VGLWSKFIATARDSKERPDSTAPTSGSLVQIAGTTTFARQGALHAASTHVDSDGYAEAVGLVTNAATCDEPPAANILVGGVRVGAVPLYEVQSLAPGASWPVVVQMFLTDTHQGQRVDAWAWIGQGAPRWQYGRSHRPPVTTGERAAEAHEQRRQLVADGLAAGGQRAERFRSGMVNGVHYLELVEPIKQLKREGRLEEALQLCYQAIQGAENDRDGREPAPAYTIHAAIIHRKLNQQDDEIAVLQRWIDHCPTDRRAGSQVAERLAGLLR